MTDSPIPRPLAELVQRSRRLGSDQSLVVYGGGNTSAKGEIIDHLGRLQRVLWVKGSGADLNGSQAADYPALRLEELLALRERPDLSDEEMTELVGRALIDPGSRRPSIETLLHAFVPFPHIDHVHADAICALTNHAEGERAVREVLGDGFAYVDWMRPGFGLSKIVGDLAHYDGVVLAHHGLVTWGDDTDSCLRATLRAVDRATGFFEGRVPLTRARHDDVPAEELDLLLTRLRGALARTGRRVLRVDPRLRSIADRADVGDVVSAGVSSADHMLRIKPWSAVAADPGDPAGTIEDYARRYDEYVERHRHQLPAGASPHDAMPRVILVPGVGAVTTGRNLREAEVAADIALRTHTVAATVADSFGSAEALPEAEIFGFDYWPMEVHKLTLAPPPPAFAGTIVIVTGAASGIGRSVALCLGELGASLVLADLDESGLAEVCDLITAAGGATPAVVIGDQSREEVADATVRTAIRTFGGLDGVVLNAGIAVTGRLEKLGLPDWQQCLDVNLTSAFLLTRAAMTALKEQGCGGSLVYVASKNALGPGAGFGAYSVSKAGMVQLMRIAALEGGEIGVRANAVNPDAVFGQSGLWAGGLREERAEAHGIASADLEEFYMSRNLLRRQVRTADVATAVAFLLSEQASRTTGTLLPVDGGVASAFPR